MTAPLRFFVTGISFKKTDLHHRSQFAFTKEQCIQHYQSAQAMQHYFILSTCNRTEIYGFAPCEYVMLSLLQRHAQVTPKQVTEYSYIKEGTDAVDHLMTVACGMDSQIPGDYEITAQLKSAFNLARESGRINGFLERLFNFSLQASKEVRTNTGFSDGTVSVVYAAAKKMLDNTSVKKVVVLGAGSTGQQTVEYLLQQSADINITVVNRTVGDSLIKPSDQVTFASLTSLTEALYDADGLIVTTSATEPLVHVKHIQSSSLKLIIDLSVPRNVSQEVYPLLPVLDVDSLSKLTQATIESRLAEVPKVKAILKDYQKQFSTWSARHHYFTVAGQASVGGSQLSAREIATLFQQWQESFTGWVLPDTHPHQSIIQQLTKHYPNVAWNNHASKSSAHEPSNSLSHTHQSPCFMASRCSCPVAEAAGC